jgi:RNA 2',3'-cyclic 3'-phosphodiesterase
MKRRLFIAVEIRKSPALVAVIDDFKKTFRNDNIKWTDNAGLHLTTQFLGDTDEDKIPQLIESISNTCKGFSIFNLAILGAGVFKNIHNPSVLWLGVERYDILKTIKEKLDVSLSNLGFQLEERAFKPHLTLGRIKQLNNTELLKTMIFKYQEKPIVQETINKVILFESELTPKGPIYKKLSVCKLEEPVV